MSKYKMEFKNFAFEPSEVKVVDKKGIVEGYASTFGNVDQGLDIVDKGAFKKTLEENGGKFPILADHNPSKQIGWNLEAREDEKGLFVKAEFDIENNATAREKYSIMAKGLAIGATPGMSIGYIPIKAEPDKERPSVRRLKELRLLEWSAVAFPMNEMASAEQVKSWHHKTIEEAVEDFYKTLEKFGHSEEDIKKALNYRAAKNSDDPHQYMQSLEELRKTLTT